MAKQNKAGNKGDSKLFAFIATFFSIIGFLIALIAKKDDKYVMYYAKQSLIVFIASLIASIIGWVFMFSMIGATIRLILNVIVLVLWVFSWIYALSGQEKEVPVIGQYAKKFNF